MKPSNGQVLLLLALLRTVQLHHNSGGAKMRQQSGRWMQGATAQFPGFGWLRKVHVRSHAITQANILVSHAGMSNIVFMYKTNACIPLHRLTLRENPTCHTCTCSSHSRHGRHSTATRTRSSSNGSQAAAAHLVGMGMGTVAAAAAAGHRHRVPTDQARSQAAAQLAAAGAGRDRQQQWRLACMCRW